MKDLRKTALPLAIALCILAVTETAEAGEFPFLNEVTLDTGAVSLNASMELVDVDADGDEDLVLQGDELGWIENDGGLDQASQLLAIGPGREATNFKIVDLDGDADPDIVAASEGLVWYENLSGGQIWTEHELGGASMDFGADVEAGDADDDGDIDVFYVADDELFVFLNEDGAFGAPLSIGTRVTAFDWLEGGDFDGDGDYDILLGESDDTGIEYMRNEGNGLQWVPTTIVSPDRVHHVAAADRDADGDLDILLGTGTHAVLLQNIDGDFAVETLIDSEIQILSYVMALGDPDVDGIDDVVVLNQGVEDFAGVHWLDGRNVDSVVDSVYGNTEDLAVGDIDCDGDDDILTLGSPGVNVGDNVVKIYINETNPKEAAGCMAVGGESDGGDETGGSDTASDTGGDDSTGGDVDSDSGQPGTSTTTGDDPTGGSDDGATSGGGAQGSEEAGGCSAGGGGRPRFPVWLLILGMAPAFLRRRG